MRRVHSQALRCCVAKWPTRADIGPTVVRNGLRHLLPASTPFQPVPSEMFGVLPNVSNFQGRLPTGRRPLFFARRNLGPRHQSARQARWSMRFCEGSKPRRQQQETVKKKGLEGPWKLPEHQARGGLERGPLSAGSGYLNEVATQEVTISFRQGSPGSGKRLHVGRPHYDRRIRRGRWIGGDAGRGRKIAWSGRRGRAGRRCIARKAGGIVARAPDEI